MNKPELMDWYKIMPKKYLLKSHNPNYKVHGITVPFRMLIIGGSGSGKTQTLLNLIHNMSGTFNYIHIITKNKDEPLYNYVVDKLGDKGLSIYEGIASAPDLDKFDKEEQSLIVFDDLVLEKNQKVIEDYYIRARKLNCSVVYLSQSYYGVPINIRRNLTYLMIKRLQSLTDLFNIMREYALGIDKNKFKTLYEASTKTKQDFLLVDLEADPTDRFRKNFDEVWDLDSTSSLENNSTSLLENNSTGRAISKTTYEKYAKKYNIPYKSKSMEELSESIYRFEESNKNIKNGLYFK